MLLLDQSDEICDIVLQLRDVINVTAPGGTRTRPAQIGRVDVGQVLAADKLG
jgi:hypothetical protein